MTTARETAKAAIEALGLTMSAEFVPYSLSRNAKSSPKLSDLSLNWKVTIRHNGRDVLTTDYGAGVAHAPSYKAPSSYQNGRYRQGSGLNVGGADAIRSECETGLTHKAPHPIHKRIEPDIADVLYCLVSDAEAIDYPTFEEWASMMGSDPDSRKAEATYRACLETGLKLRSALGDDGLSRLREAFQDF